MTLPTSPFHCAALQFPLTLKHNFHLAFDPADCPAAVPSTDAPIHGRLCPSNYENLCTEEISCPSPYMEFYGFFPERSATKHHQFFWIVSASVVSQYTCHCREHITPHPGISSNIVFTTGIYDTEHLGLYFMVHSKLRSPLMNYQHPKTPVPYKDMFERHDFKM